MREIGQLSLHSSPLFKRLARIDDSNKEDSLTKSPKEKKSCISLSDFLNRKLQRTSTPAKTVQSKLNPFSSLVGDKDTVGTLDTNVGVKRGAAKIDEETIFERFKCPRKENEESDGSGCRGELGRSTTTDDRDLQKRRNPFHVSSLDERNTTPRYVLVLGDDAKCKQNGREVSFNEGNKLKPLFNHYANGSGWWDCDMEGLDSEVGSKEVWEGMGSTTLGGLEWH